MFVKMTDLELGFKVWVRYDLVENGKPRHREQNELNHGNGNEYGREEKQENK